MTARRATASASGDELDAVANHTHRLAVLLAAGLDPLGAIRALDEAPPPVRAAASCETPHEVPDALLGGAASATPVVRRAWAMLAAHWAVAVEAGAPLADALERTAETLRALAEADRRVDLELAGPLATGRIVAFLPLAGLAIGVLVGADPLGVLLGTVPGAVAGVLGLFALGGGVRWTRALVARARLDDPLAGLGTELLALALAGGGAPESALRLVSSTLDACGLPGALDGARATLEFAGRVGVSASALLRADAARERRLALAAALRRAALLGSRLLAPLGLCFLPSFVLVGVVPIVVGILRGSLASF